jgi:hypothetical protein
VPPPPPPRIQVRPRVSFEGALVMSRKRWMVPMQLFPQREPHESGADFFLRANRWRHEAGIPETAYISITPMPDPLAPKPDTPAEGESPGDAEAQPDAATVAQPEAAAEAPQAADEEHDEAGDDAAEGGEGADKQAAKPRTPGSRDLHKPQFIDFANPLLVGLLGKMGANLKRYTVDVEERLPSREALPVHDGRAYAAEVVVQLYYPGGTASAAADAQAAEEEHAAALA